MAKQKKDARRQPRMAGNRRQFLTYLPPQMILDVKRLALESGISASDVVQEAVNAWLARRKGRQPRGSE
jgi:hypothetical protein